MDSWPRAGLRVSQHEQHPSNGPMRWCVSGSLVPPVSPTAPRHRRWPWRHAYEWTEVLVGRGGASSTVPVVLHNGTSYLTSKSYRYCTVRSPTALSAAQETERYHLATSYALEVLVVWDVGTSRYSTGEYCSLAALGAHPYKQALKVSCNDARQYRRAPVLP